MPEQCGGRHTPQCGLADNAIEGACWGPLSTRLLWSPAHDTAKAQGDKTKSDSSAGLQILLALVYNSATSKTHLCDAQGRIIWE